MIYTSAKIGEEVKRVRKALQVTQRDLAFTSGTGLRFIIDLEKGKPTCQLAKVLSVLNTLGIDLELTPRAAIASLGRPMLLRADPSVYIT